MAVNSSQPTVYCVINFFSLILVHRYRRYYPNRSLWTTKILLSGEFTAAEFRALICGAMDIESTTWTMNWTTTTLAAVAAQSRQRRGSMIPWCHKSRRLPLERIVPLSKHYAGFCPVVTRLPSTSSGVRSREFCIGRRGGG